MTALLSTTTSRPGQDVISETDSCNAPYMVSLLGKKDTLEQQTKAHPKVVGAHINADMMIHCT